MTVYKELAARLHVPDSLIIPRLLEILVDKTDARILLALPADVPTLTDKFHLPAATLEAKLHEMYLKGIVFPSKKTSPPTYRMAREILQLHDTSVQWKKAPKEFLDLWSKKQWCWFDFWWGMTGCAAAMLFLYFSPCP